MSHPAATVVPPPQRARRGARAIVVLALALAACRGGGGGGGGMAIPVGVAAARPATEAIDHRYVASLEAAAAIVVASEVAGRVEQIAADDGAEVAAGDLLFAIGTRQRLARRNQARAAYELSEREAARARELLAAGAATPQDRDRAEAELSMRQAELDLAQTQLDDAYVRAPFAGRLGARRVDAGQFVQPGARLIDLVAADPIRATAHVPEADLALLRRGQRAAVEVTPRPGRRFVGTIDFVAPLVDPETRTIEVRATVPNPTGALLPGMLASLIVAGAPLDDAVAVPERALIVVGTSASVYAVGADDTAAMLPVTVVHQGGGEAWLRGHLAPGRLVVVDGVQKVRPGAPVRYDAPAGASTTGSTTGTDAP